MAVIPNVTRIARASPTDRGFVVGSVNDPTPGAASQAAQAVNAAQQRKTQFQGAMADSRYRSATIALDDEFDRDEDYNTMPDRYERKARDKLGEVADSIGDPRAKAMFLEAQEATVQAGMSRIRDKAWGVEKDFMRAGVDEQLLAEENAVISGDSEAVDRAMMLIDGGAGADYLTAEEAQTAKQSFKTNSAVKWLGSIAPEKRLAALKEPLADNLPPDVRAKMTREAEVAMRAGVAQAAVDTMMDDYPTRATGLTEIAKIGDVALRDETQRRFDNALNAREAAEAEWSVSKHEEYFNSVLTGNMSIDDIDPVDIEAMKPAQLANLYAAEAASVKPTTKSDRDVVDKLYELKAAKNQSGLRDYFLENSAKLSDGDYKSWSETSTKGVTPPEYKSLFATVGSMRSKLDGANIKSKADQDNYRQAMTDWHMDYFETNQKLPDDAAIERKMDRLLIETSEAPGWFGTTRVFEMDQSELTQTITNMSTSRPEIFAEVLSTFPDPTQVPPDEFIEAYEARLNAQ